MLSGLQLYHRYCSWFKPSLYGFLSLSLSICGLYFLDSYDKQPCAYNSFLSLPKLKEGVGLLDTISYLKAWVVSWCTQGTTKPWVTIEQEHFLVPLTCILWLSSLDLPSFRVHLTIGATLRVSSCFIFQTSQIYPSCLLQWGMLSSYLVILTNTLTVS